MRHPFGLLKTLDKTFIYEYNSNGNVTKVQLRRVGQLHDLERDDRLPACILTWSAHIPLIPGIVGVIEAF